MVDPGGKILVSYFPVVTTMKRPRKHGYTKSPFSSLVFHLPVFLTAEIESPNHLQIMLHIGCASKFEDFENEMGEKELNYRLSLQINMSLQINEWID